MKRRSPQRQKAKAIRMALPILQLDENRVELKERYGLISKNKKFNEEKFKDEMI